MHNKNELYQLNNKRRPHFETRKYGNKHDDEYKDDCEIEELLNEKAKIRKILY